MAISTRPGSGVTILMGLLAIGLGFGAASIILIPSWTALGLTYLLLLINLLIFVTTRHIQITSRSRTRRAPKPGDVTLRDRQMDYFLFVLGSGGHTKEMLMMMDDGFCDFKNAHRRYLISSGDRMSENHLEDYEADLKTLCEGQKQSPGTYDKCIVTRARRVHQPLWSTPFTALLSILDIFPVLLSPPRNEAGRKMQYPTQVFSNGPATGFFVGLAAHVLKIFFLAPQDAMKVIYIESWARITTLSLTGKLFYYTGTADLFFVQHDQVAAKYGIPNAGEMVFNSRRPDT